MTNSKACGCNAISTGQLTRVQIPGIQLTPRAKSSLSSAEIPSSSTQISAGDALVWLFQSLHSPWWWIGGTSLWLWGRGAW